MTLTACENHRLASALVESDRAYFAASADVRDTPVARLFCLKGLSRLPSGCVAFANPALPADAATLARGLDALEQAVRSAGCPRVRLYTHETPAALGDLLIERGYRGRDELAMITTALADAPAAGVELEPVVDDAGWRDKLELTSACGAGPDGYDMDPAAWCDMERQRVVCGAMRCFIVRDELGVCGAVGSLDHGPLMRLKNLLVHPNRRGKGLGAAITLALIHRARRAGKTALGCFAIDGGAGERAYRKAGMTCIGRQTEWLRATLD